MTDFYTHQNVGGADYTTLIVKSNGSLWSLGYGARGALGVTLSGFSDPLIPSLVEYPMGTSTPVQVIGSGVSQVSSYIGDDFNVNKGKNRIFENGWESMGLGSFRERLFLQ